jgi:hypothetical protein
LYLAQLKGVTVDAVVLDKAADYTVASLRANPAGTVSGAGGGIGMGTGAGVGAGVGGGIGVASAAAAGVPLYQNAQALEQLSRTEADRQKNAKEIAAIQSQLSNQRFVEGFGSIGGEEFFSYLNISDSLKRTGGAEWKDWHATTTKKILDLQNNDGTWAGHHCITGRVAVTSAAILNLTVEP